MNHKRVSKFKVKITYKFNDGIKTPQYTMVAKYKDLETGSIDRITLKEFCCSKEAEEYVIEQNKLSPLVSGAESAKKYLLEKIFPRFEDQSLKFDLKDLNEEVIVEIANIFREDHATAERLKSPEVPNNIVASISHLTRNEKQIIINLIGSQSMLAVLVDEFTKIPQSRQSALLPLRDYIIDICDKIDYLNDAVAHQAVRTIGAKKFNDHLGDVATMNDFMAGKITKCLTCTAWLDQKAKNGRILRGEIDG